MRDLIEHQEQSCGCCAGIEVSTPGVIQNRPGLDELRYRVGTHTTFFESMLARLSSLCDGSPKACQSGTGQYPLRDRLTARNRDDHAIALLDAWASVGDVLTFYQERIANEGYLRTANERRSLYELAGLIGYHPKPGVSAQAYLAFEVEAQPSVTTAIGLGSPANFENPRDTEIAVPQGTKAQSTPTPGTEETPQIFETSHNFTARPSWNQMRLATSRPYELGGRLSSLSELKLKGTGLRLSPNDLMVISVGGTRHATKKIQAVTEDTDQQTTHLEFDFYSVGDLQTDTNAAIEEYLRENIAHIQRLGLKSTLDKVIANKNADLLKLVSEKNSNASEKPILQEPTLAAIDYQLVEVWQDGDSGSHKELENILVDIISQIHFDLAEKSIQWGRKELKADFPFPRSLSLNIQSLSSSLGQAVNETNKIDFLNEAVAAWCFLFNQVLPVPTLSGTFADAPLVLPIVQLDEEGKGEVTLVGERLGEYFQVPANETYRVVCTLDSADFSLTDGVVAVAEGDLIQNLTELSPQVEFSGDDNLPRFSLLVLNISLKDSDGITVKSTTKIVPLRSKSGQMSLHELKDKLADEARAITNPDRESANIYNAQLAQISGVLVAPFDVQMLSDLEEQVKRLREFNVAGATQWESTVGMLAGKAKSLVEEVKNKVEAARKEWLAEWPDKLSSVPNDQRKYVNEIFERSDNGILAVLKNLEVDGQSIELSAVDSALRHTLPGLVSSVKSELDLELAHLYFHIARTLKARRIQILQKAVLELGNYNELVFHEWLKALDVQLLEGKIYQVFPKGFYQLGEGGEWKRIYFKEVDEIPDDVDEDSPVHLWITSGAPHLCVKKKTDEGYEYTDVEVAEFRFKQLLAERRLVFLAARLRRQLDDKQLRDFVTLPLPIPTINGRSDEESDWWKGFKLPDSDSSLIPVTNRAEREGQIQIADFLRYLGVPDADQQERDRVSEDEAKSLLEEFLKQSQDARTVSQFGDQDHINSIIASIVEDLNPGSRSRFVELLRQYRYVPKFARNTVSVMRTKARVFGWNASFEKLGFTKTQAELFALKILNHDSQDSINAGQERNDIAKAIEQIKHPISSENEVVENSKNLYLDGPFNGVVEGDPIVVENVSSNADSNVLPKPHFVNGVTTHPRTAYGLSGETTRIELDSPWYKGDKPTSIEIRTTRVHCEAEQLPLDEEPLSEILQPDEILELNGVYPALHSGKKLVLTGIPHQYGPDSPIQVSELVEVGQVKFSLNSKGYGAKFQTQVRLTKPLSHTYLRASVRILGNVVEATHGETKSEILGSGRGGKALDAFELKAAPLTYVAALSPSGVRPELTVQVNQKVWKGQKTLMRSEETDEHFTLSHTADQRTRVQFGDGERGRRLPTGEANIKVTYRAGIGSAGNVAANQIDQLVGPPLGVKGVLNPLKAKGGADPDGADVLRERIPVGLTSLDRVISAKDYEDFAENFSGISKAHVQRTPEALKLTVAGPRYDSLTPNHPTLELLKMSLHQFSGTQRRVELVPFQPVLIGITARVAIHPDKLWDDVHRRLLQLLYDRFSFEQARFGQVIEQSELIAALQSDPDVVYVDLEAVRVSRSRYFQSADGSGKEEENRRPINSQSVGAETLEVGEPVRAISHSPDLTVGAELCYISRHSRDTVELLQIVRELP